MTNSYSSVSCSPEWSASRFVEGMFAVGGLGGATLPWLVGLASNRFGNLMADLWIPVLSAFAMCGLRIGSGGVAGPGEPVLK